MPFDGFLTGDGNHAPDYVKNGNFVLNKESLQSQELVGWWPMFGQNTNFALTSKDIKPVLSSSGASFEAGHAGSLALKLTGGVSEEAITAEPSSDDPLLVTGPVTVSIWGFLTDATPQFTVAFCKGITSTSPSVNGPWGIYYQNDDNVRAVISQTGIGADTAVSTNGVTKDVVVHYVLTWTGVAEVGSLKLYQDGLLLASGATGIVTSLTHSDDFDNFICFGNDPQRDDARMGWQGWLWDGRIYNRHFSASEVFHLFSPSTRWDLYYETGRVAYFFVPAVAGFVPHNPLGHPLIGPFGGPV